MKLPGPDCRPPVIAAAARFKGQWFHADKGIDLPHPAVLLTTSWATIEDRVIRFLDQLKATPELRDRTASNELLDAYRSLIYAIVEFNEGVAQNLRDCVTGKAKNGPQKFVLNGEAALRKSSNMICNKLKHNHRRLSAVSARHLLGTVHGFVVIASQGNSAVIPDADIHRRSSAFSFHRHIISLFADTYELSELACAALDAIPGDNAPQRGNTDPGRTAEIMAQLAKLPLFIFPTERGLDAPLLAFEGGSLEINRHGGKAMTMVGDVRWTQAFNGDGFTNSYPLVGDRPVSMTVERRN